MAFKKSFVVSDESVNSYGFWVRTGGIQLDKAKQNCPAFFNHESWKVPLGHWENFRVDETSRLLADLIIEGANEDEKTFIRKIENGDIKGASIGVDVITLNDDPSVLKPGQIRPALSDSELFEISITPLPGNNNALALRYKGNLITLTDGNINGSFPIPLLHKEPDMKSIALKLGLPETATESQILEIIGKLQLSASAAEDMRSHIESQATQELDGDESKQLFNELSKTNFKAAMAFFKLNRKPAETATPSGSEDATKVKKNISVSDLVQKGKQQLSNQTGNPDNDKDCFDFLQRHNTAELARIKKEEPGKYQHLVDNYSKGVRYKQ